MILAMKVTIGVMGASRVPNTLVEQAAQRLGSLIAARGAVLITGATVGLPFAAAKGAKEAGGQVLGFSPALNQEEHLRLGLPLTDHDLIIYTGFSFKGRNLLNVRASHDIIFIGGSMGALNEFTIAYDEEKIIGILEGSGGFCDHLQEWMESMAKPGNRAVVHYSNDSSRLVDQVIESVRIQYPDLE